MDDKTFIKVIVANKNSPMNQAPTIWASEKKYTGILVFVNDDRNAIFFKNGVLHREDGPAIIRKNENIYWLDGHPCPKNSFLEYKEKYPSKEIIKVKTDSNNTFGGIPIADFVKKTIFTGVVEDYSGGQHSYKEGIEVGNKLKIKSTEDIPPCFTGIAVAEEEFKYRNITFLPGDTIHFLCGTVHRNDGPAILSGRGEQDNEYYYFGTEVENFKILKLVSSFFRNIKSKKKLNDTNPVKFLSFNSENEKKLDSNFTGVVFVESTGIIERYENGKLNSLFGPARITIDGTFSEYYINGEKLADSDEYAKCVYALDSCSRSFSERVVPEYDMHHKLSPTVVLEADEFHTIAGIDADDFIKMNRFFGTLYSQEKGWMELTPKQFIENCYKEINKQFKIEETKYITNLNDFFTIADRKYTGKAITVSDVTCDGFAIGDTFYYQNGRLHNENGPAFIGSNGRRTIYFIDGQRLSKKKFEERARGLENQYVSNKYQFVDIADKNQKEQTMASTDQSSSKKEEVQSEKLVNVKTIIVSDAQIVAKRIAVLKISQFVKSLIIGLLTNSAKSKQKSQITEKLTEFFSTEIGKALLMILISQLLPKLLKLEAFKKLIADSHHKMIDSLSDEFRIQSETEIALIVFEKFETVISGLIQQLSPSIEETVNLRIDLQSESSSTNDTKEQEMEPLKMVAGFMNK